MGIEKINISDYFATSDLGLASAISLFMPLWALDRKKSSEKVEFLFIRNEQLDSIIENYWKNNLNVSALALFQQIKITKSRLYEQK
ncbi:MAG: hypothetical protein ABSE04_01690 [Candidatus Microgenomates bacterium]|jgi:hypothetical protein